MINKKFATVLILFILIYQLVGGVGTGVAYQGITPHLNLDQSSYSPGDRVELDLSLTEIQAGDQTNSVTFEIEYDSEVLELATGDINQDVQGGYIPFTTKDRVGSGTVKSVKVMYVHPETDIKLVEGEKVLSISFKVKENAKAGKINITLKAVDILDTQFKYYTVNQGRPLTIHTSIDTDIEDSEEEPRTESEVDSNPEIDLLQQIEKGYQIIGQVYEITAAEKTTISYKDHPLIDINEEKLGIYQWNENKKNWTYIGGKVNKLDNSIEFSAGRVGKYAIMEYNKTFADLDNHWAKSDIELMASKHIVKGKKDMSYAPNEEVSRAEFAALLVRVLGENIVEGNNNLPFTDVKPSKWYYNEVAIAYNYGIINGLSETAFGPDENITRQQMAVMIIRAMTAADMNVELTNDQVREMLSKFEDQTYIAAWAIDDVAAAIQLGIVNGRSTDSFVPSENATRAESAVMITRVFKLLN
jgi:hypothetical protein